MKFFKREVKGLKKEELEEAIKSTEEKIETYQQSLSDLKERLHELVLQEKERENYISSKEIVDLIFKNTGKKNNMSTIKRWADEGYLGEVLDEKEKFWALPSKQGKKRFLYPKKDVYSFLYEKGYLQPQYRVLDRVQMIDPGHEPAIGIVINSFLKKNAFHYTIQVEGSYEIIENIKEMHLNSVQ